LWQEGYRVVLVHAVKARRKSGGITPPILNLGTRWRSVVNFIPFLLHTCAQNAWYPLNGREAEFAAEPFWMFWRRDMSLALARNQTQVL